MGERRHLDGPGAGRTLAFNARVRLLWFGAGTPELREWVVTQRRLAELGKAGICYTYWETPDVAPNS